MCIYMSLVRSLVRKLGLFWGDFSQIQQYLNSIFWLFWYYFSVSFSIHFMENNVAFHKIYSKAYINIIPMYKKYIIRNSCQNF